MVSLMMPRIEFMLNLEILTIVSVKDRTGVYKRIKGL